MTDAGQNLTALLRAASEGEAAAQSRLLEAVYGELRQRAERAFRAAGSGVTLQPTILVHDAWARLFSAPGAVFRDRSHFFAVAAKAMRRLALDHARAVCAQKRGGDRASVTLHADLVGASPKGVDVLDLEEALTRLEAEAPLAARLVELKFYAGLEGSEIAAALSVSESTVDREWRAARAWLKVFLSEADRG